MYGDPIVPFAGFEDFDECVVEMEGEGHDEESARSICGALQEEAKADNGNIEQLREAIAEGSGLVADVGVDLLSGVDVPAVDSKWVMFKSGGGRRGRDYRVDTPILLDKADADSAEKRISYAAAMIPREPDKEGDVVPTPTVEKAAHDFLKSDGGIDTDHSLIDGEGQPVESWVLKEERTFDLPDGGTETYPAGTWMVGIEWGAEAWQRIQDGELTGLSIYGMAEHVPLARSRGETPNTDSEQSNEQNQSMTDSDTDGDGSGGDDGPTLKDVTERLDSLAESMPEQVEKQPTADEAAGTLADEYSLSEGEIWEVLDLADNMGVEELMEAAENVAEQAETVENEDGDEDEKSDTESADTETAEKRAAEANTGKAGSRGADTAAKAQGAQGSGGIPSYAAAAEERERDTGGD